MQTYVVLLRGINVGGNNLIKMSDLKTCLEGAGLANVRTYIQSGNVVFESSQTNSAKLTATIEALLSKTFAYKSRVVIRSHNQLAATIQNAPKGFGSDPTTYRYDVIFLKEPLTAEQAMASVAPKEGVDTVAASDGVLYFSRLIAKATQSHLSRIIGTPIYQNMTIRNWNTTTKLLQIMDAPT